MTVGYLSYILNSVWSMHGDHLDGYLPYIKQLIDGNVPQQKSIEEIEQLYSRTNAVAQNSVLFPVSEYGSNISDSNAVPNNSIALISFRGVITKYDQMGACSYGPAGTITKEAILDRVFSNSKIKGVIALADTPGGEASAPERIANKIRMRNKPFVTVVDGLFASAGVFALTPSDAIVLTAETDIVGSIGTMFTALDIRGKLEKDGYKIVEEYATESTEKNLMFRNAFKGDTKQLKQYLDVLQANFKASVIKDRGEKIKDKPVLSGREFIGSAAIENGLADYMGGIPKAIEIINELNSSSQITYKF